MERIQITGHDGNHSYDVEATKDGITVVILEINANTRSQASKLAKAYGYIVRSVNMIG